MIEKNEVVTLYGFTSSKGIGYSLEQIGIPPESELVLEGGSTEPRAFDRITDDWSAALEQIEILNTFRVGVFGVVIDYKNKPAEIAQQLVNLIERFGWLEVIERDLHRSEGGAGASESSAQGSAVKPAE